MRQFTKYPQGYVKASSIEADNKVYKISDNPSMYTNIDFDNMYAELDKEYARYPNAKGYIDGSIKLHLDYGFITRAEANALRAKYLGN